MTDQELAEMQARDRLGKWREPSDAWITLRDRRTLLAEVGKLRERVDEFETHDHAHNIELLDRGYAKAEEELHTLRAIVQELGEPAEPIRTLLEKDIPDLLAELRGLREEAKAWCQRISDMDQECQTRISPTNFVRCPDYGRCPHTRQAMGEGE